MSNDSKYITTMGDKVNLSVHQGFLVVNHTVQIEQHTSLRVINTNVFFRNSPIIIIYLLHKYCQTHLRCAIYEECL